MVVNTPVSASGLSGGVKRPLSTMQDGCAGWATSSAHMGPSLRTTPSLPFEHYALIYYDNMGKIEVAESTSIREQNCSVITPDVRERFREILGPRIGYHKPLLRRASAVPHAYNHAHDMASPRLVKRRKASNQHHGPQIACGERFPEPVPQIPSSSYSMVPMRIGDTKKVTEYYENSFENLQQTNCRFISKAFIKEVEPKKQVNHPYKGNKQKGKKVPEEECDPEKTKPGWWPATVQHKEPDHLKKEKRICLLIHMVRQFPADRLQLVAQDCKRSLKPENMIEERWEMIAEIFKVRRLEERFERGEVDASHVVYIRNCDKDKNSKDNESVISDTEPKLEAEDFDNVEEDPFTTASSSENLPSFASVDPLALQQPRTFGMSNDPFPLNESLNFQDPSRQGRPYYTTSAEYTEDYSSHSVLRPATTSLVGPDEHTEAFDYMNHAPFTTSAVSDHHRPLTMQQVNHYDIWSSPFRPNIYNSMDYGTSPTLAQNPMHYPMALTSSQADIPHGLPDLGRDRPPSWASLNKSF
ncbi:hypothetical protein BDV10DRAFT_85438 [Aspergillus recurvatus]